MLQRLIGAGVVLLLAWGCSDTSSFWVTVRFPDQQSKDEAKLVSVFAIEPSEGSSCQALQDGSAEPGDSGYIVEDQVDVGMPATEGGRPLEDIGPGERLFFASVTDQQDRIFLRGCTPARAGGKGAQTVTIELIKIPECNITRQGVEWCDSLDNDCDGDTDENCTACQADADCVDADSCLQGTCTDGICSTDPSPDGTACDDGLYCTENDQCTSGACAGTARDCSAEGDDCNQGVCDDDADACTRQVLADGIGCDDGLYCTTDESCLSGACQGGQPQDCSAMSAECVEGVCNDDTDSCEGRPMQDSEACDDGEYCTVGETCLSGACQGGQPRDCSQNCVDGSCNENQDRCVGTSLPAGTACEDGLYCTENDACDGQGSCLGDDRDCSAEDDACNSGVCDDQADACTKQPLTNGTGCEDGLYCTVNDTCQSGACTAGQPRDCSAVADQCNDGLCRENQDRCRPEPKQAGTACDDSIACTSPDQCDGNGNCGGVPDDTACPAGQFCRPACSTSADGCMPSPVLTVDCPDTVLVDQAATCTVTAEGLSNQESCITCVPHLLQLNLPLVDFSQNCDFQGWQLESSNLCQDPALALPACPLDSTLGTGPAPCCDSLLCPTQTWTGGSQLEAVEAKLADCSNEDWRLSRIFDLRGFGQGKICYDFGAVNTGAADQIQVQADPLNEFQRVVIRCRTGAIPSGAMMVDCHDLPAAVFGWSQTRLTVWMHSNTPLHAWILDNLWVTARYPACQPTTVVAFEEDFEGCPATIPDGFNDWIVQGSPGCLTTACGSAGLQVQPTDVWTIERDVDTSALTGEVYLCWTEGDESGSIATFQVAIDAGGGLQPVYEDLDNQIYGAVCARNCRELTAIDPAAAGNPALKILFHMEGNTNLVMLDDITVSGPERCDATGLIQAGAPTPLPNDYGVDVTNLSGIPYQVMLECRWSGAGPEATASDSFFFRMP